VDQHSRAFRRNRYVKVWHAVAVAEDGRAGMSLSWRDRHTERTTRKRRHQLAAKYRQLTFLRGRADGIRALSADHELGHDCIVAAPSLDPEETWRSGETNRRDAVA